jgi:glutathione synthase
MSDPLQIAFVMDPIESVNIEEDTTFALMLESQARGHGVLYVDPADLGVTGGRAVARARPVQLRREHGNHVDLAAERLVVLDESVDLIWQRTDPPVDAAYVTATQLLGMCREALVVNRPSSILSYNEKLFALHFADLMPPTMVSRRASELLEFMDENGGEMIVKPLDGRGGEGIFHTSREDRNLNSILEQSTRFGTVRAMAQRFLPAVWQGDKRILLLDGEPLGALLRVPSEGDVRANLHVGGEAARGVLDDADRRIIERLAPVLKRDGLFFVGIDVIGGLLTEINVTSPTCIQEIGRIDGVSLETQVLERAEAAVAAHRRERIRN